MVSVSNQFVYLELAYPELVEVVEPVERSNYFLFNLYTLRISSLALFVLPDFT